ncbi:DUF3375 domain-containing protein [Amorphoplanes nipponensis]|uniref:DUF3375 domain-containing protein n=1 Tax=Actinoplanes nipponensis TaxID=135950 RepID=A0A919MP24_9ACTN|nr:DUF3375 domain-containing protein [Actinoplanes nipponensis]GIE51592.1 hypothetical protein Ani05nite_51260 [Actinoplanes nipponensis]
MADIVGELARVAGAFDQPTLTLLYKGHARVVIAVFRTVFSRDVRTVPTARLHEQVDTYLDHLRSAGISDLPAGSGRDLCLRWMRGRWLVRSVEDGGTEVYTLTSHAQDALNLVTSLTRERGSLSEHRIATIVNAVRRFNTEVNPDRAARVSILNSEIERLSAERDRLLGGGVLPQVSADYMLEGFGELLQLVAALPSDFARVQEAFAMLRAQILASFRADNRPTGEVIDDYLRRTDSLMSATAEGRAFEGAFTLLRDDGLLLQLREDLTALLDHPVADDILNAADRRDLRGTVTLIRNGIDGVLTQRNRVTATLREYIQTHNTARDRELDATLRQLDAELARWMNAAGPRSAVDLPLLPPRLDIHHLRERFHNPNDEAELPALRDVGDHRPDRLSLAQLLAQGGPSLDQLRAAIEQAFSADEPVNSLGQLFGGLEIPLRRPVEIFGLLHLAANLGGFNQQHDHDEVYRAVRPDGSARDLNVPLIAVNRHEPGRMSADDDNREHPGQQEPE